MARRSRVDHHAPKYARGKMPRRGRLRRARHFLRTESLRARRNCRAHSKRNRYDDDRIIAGQATAAKELLEEIPDLDAVLAPVSGGGLLSGTCLGAKGIRAGVRVFGCEPERADDAARSLASGTLQSLESADTIADGLRASLAPRTFAILRRHVERILLVSEEEIIATTRLVWERMKIIIEPSSAVALAPLLRADTVASLDLPKRPDGGAPKLGVIFSGGNVDLSSLPF